MRRRVRTLVFLSLISFAALAVSPGASGVPSTPGGSLVPVPEPVEPSAASARQAAQLTADMLSGLRLRNIGPAVMSGRFVDIEVVESDPYEFFVASSTGGIFRTTNNGVTFAAVFENEATHSIGDIAIFQPDPNIIWVGTGERANRQSSSWGDGIYKSTDRGETWTNVGLRDSHHVGRILTHPSNPDVAYVAAMGHLWGSNEERGLYRTEDGGSTWQRLLYIDHRPGHRATDPSFLCRQHFTSFPGTHLTVTKQQENHMGNQECHDRQGSDDVHRIPQV